MLLFTLPFGCRAVFPAQGTPERNEEVIAYRLVEPLFNADQDSRIMWTAGGSEAPQALFEHQGVCVGCHSFSSQGFIALNVKKKGDRRLVIFRSDGAGLHLYDTKKIGEFSFLAWSPDSRHLAMVVNSFGVINVRNDVTEPFDLVYRSGDIAIYDPATKEIRLLPGASEMDFVEDMPAWSPDGEDLLFVKYKSERDAPVDSMSIYRVPFNSGEGGTPEPVVLASGKGDYTYFPAYSPDDRWISFVKGDGSRGVFARKTSDIYIMPRAGGPAKKLAINTDGVMDSWHRWSRNGQRIFFSSKRDGYMTALYQADLDDGDFFRTERLIEHAGEKVNLPEFLGGWSIKATGEAKKFFYSQIESIYDEVK